MALHGFGAIVLLFALSIPAHCIQAYYERDYNSTIIENIHDSLVEAAELHADELGTALDSVDATGLKFTDVSNSDFANVQPNLRPAVPIVFAKVCNNRATTAVACEVPETAELPVMISIVNNYGMESGEDEVEIEVDLGSDPFDLTELGVPGLKQVKFTLQHGAAARDAQRAEAGSVKANKTRVDKVAPGECAVIFDEFTPIMLEWGFDWVSNVSGQVEVRFADAVDWNLFHGDNTSSAEWHPDIGGLVPAVKGLAVSQRLENVQRNHSRPGAAFTGTSRLRLLTYELVTTVSRASGGDCDAVTPCHRDDSCHTYNSTRVAAKELGEAFLGQGVRMSRSGEACGVGRGVCSRGLCCSAGGFCSKAPDACGMFCNREFGRCDPPPELGAGVPNFPSEGLFLPNASSVVDRFREGSRVSPRWLPTNSSGIVLAITGEHVRVVMPGGVSRCGVGENGAGFGICSQNECCSAFGYCGGSAEYCQVQQGCQEAYGGCDPMPAGGDGQAQQRFAGGDQNGGPMVSEGMWCGAQSQGSVCKEGNGCCGADRHCSANATSCLVGCQPQYTAEGCKTMQQARTRIEDGGMLCGEFESMCPLGWCCGGDGRCSREQLACGEECDWNYSFCAGYPNIPLSGGGDGNAATRTSGTAVWSGGVAALVTLMIGTLLQ